MYGNNKRIRRTCADVTGNRYCKGFRWRFPTLLERIKFNNSKQRKIKNNL